MDFLKFVLNFFLYVVCELCIIYFGDIKIFLILYKLFIDKYCIILELLFERISNLLTRF